MSDIFRVRVEPCSLHVESTLEKHRCIELPVNMCNRVGFTISRLYYSITFKNPVKFCEAVTAVRVSHLLLPELSSAELPVGDDETVSNTSARSLITIQLYFCTCDATFKPV